MKDRIDALKVALDNERRERDFYRSQARHTDMPWARPCSSRSRRRRMSITSESWPCMRRGPEAAWPETVPLQVGAQVPTILKKFLAQAKSDSGRGCR